MLYRVGAVCLFLAFFAGVVSADERRFGYSYEADVLPKGKLEYEHWVTLRSGKDNGHYSRWDFRHELEYGLTDNLTTALYANFVQKNSLGRGADSSSFSFEGISSEWKYLLSSPYLNPIGVLLYGEARFSGPETELEEKLILQHINGPWNFVTNIIFEQEWEVENNSSEYEHATAITGGVSYRMNPNLSLGLEFKSKEKDGESAFFAGPNMAYSDGKFWTVLTVLPQVGKLNVNGYESMEVRCITGVVF